MSITEPSPNHIGILLQSGDPLDNAVQKDRADSCFKIISEAHSKKGEFLNAFKIANLTYDINSRDKLIGDLFNKHFINHSLESTIKMINELKEEGHRAWSLKTLARVYAEQGKVAQAEEIAALVTPSGVQEFAFGDISLYLAKSGDFEGAARLITKIESQSAINRFYFSLAKIYCLSGEYDRAICYAEFTEDSFFPYRSDSFFLITLKINNSGNHEKAIQVANCITREDQRFEAYTKIIGKPTTLEGIREAKYLAELIEDPHQKTIIERGLLELEQSLPQVQQTAREAVRSFPSPEDTGIEEPSPYQKCLDLIETDQLDKALKIARSDIKITDLAENCLRMISETYSRKGKFLEAFRVFNATDSHENNLLIEFFNKCATVHIPDSFLNPEKKIHRIKFFKDVSRLFNWTGIALQADLKAKQLASKADQANSKVNQALSEAKQAKSKTKQLAPKANQALSEVKQARSEFKQVDSKLASETIQAISQLKQAVSKLEQAHSKARQANLEAHQTYLKLNQAIHKLEQARSEIEQTYPGTKKVLPLVKHILLELEQDLPELEQDLPEAEQILPESKKDPSKCCVVL